MSKNILKDHKGTALFTTIVAGTALAPILSGQLQQGEQGNTMVEFLHPLSTSAPYNTQSQQAFAVLHSLPHMNQSSHTFKEPLLSLSNISDHSSSTTTNEKWDNSESHLRLVSKEWMDTYGDQIASSAMTSIWPKDTVLRHGDEGPKVKTIQKHLKEIGYYVATIDGKFNDSTFKAVKLYQKEHGLPIDGEVKYETIVHLIGTKHFIHTMTKNSNAANDISTIYSPNNEDDEYLYITPQPLKKDEAEEKAFERSYFQYGDKHDDIVFLQEQLKKGGYYNGETDGYYDSLTQQAVRTLQKEHNLMVDGLAGNQVFTFIETADLKKIAENRQNEQRSVQRNEQISTEQEAAQSIPENSKEEEIEKQKLEKNSEVASSAPSSTYSTEEIITRAKELIGTPYSWGGTTPSGFDCSGFLVYLYSYIDESLSRTVDGIWGETTSVSTPERGDFVFFETYKPGPSHAGIYLGDGAFIHTDATAGVKISYLDESYWGNRYLGARRK
ncbi:peptidoglycan-binding protein [Evansella sp. AB-P1]|uniref:C40 family peptidase n=1 Tax=Evansella sp. AB-P1 TaxID=3037653 RepID=UPI00241FB193|nr:peptidoglycan-binding protein [Evansella sp. AB-P1]MDG5789943.1 peptidoglycan-binding protein [Evansella sp. AB-P1]